MSQVHRSACSRVRIFGVVAPRVGRRPARCRAGRRRCRHRPGRRRRCRARGGSPRPGSHGRRRPLALVSTARRVARTTRPRGRSGSRRRRHGTSEGHPGRRGRLRDTGESGHLHDVVGRLIAAGHRRAGDPRILIVADTGYDITRLVHARAASSVQSAVQGRGRAVVIETGKPVAGPLRDRLTGHHLHRLSHVGWTVGSRGRSTPGAVEDRIRLTDR
jgi:hypothetical protein